MKELFHKKGHDSLHYIYASSPKSSNILTLLVHGANRQYQNVESFSKNMTSISEISDVVAVSLVGHGKSTPGPKDFIPNNSRPIESQVEIVKELLEKEFPDKKYLLVGRSYGGRVVMNLAKELLAQVIGFVFIAPAGSDYYARNAELQEIPVLLIWIEDDPIIKFEQAKIFEKNAKKLTKLYLEPLNQKEEPWRSHSAQEEKPEEVNKTIIEFISSMSKIYS